jgi:hypothetical protein
MCYSSKTNDTISSSGAKEPWRLPALFNGWCMLHEAFTFLCQIAISRTPRNCSKAWSKSSSIIHLNPCQELWTVFPYGYIHSYARVFLDCQVACAVLATRVIRTSCCHSIHFTNYRYLTDQPMEFARSVKYSSTCMERGDQWDCHSTQTYEGRGNTPAPRMGFECKTTVFERRNTSGTLARAYILKKYFESEKLYNRLMLRENYMLNAIKFCRFPP